MTGPSLAQVNLEYSLGERMVSLADLRDEEFAEVLTKWFGRINVGDLRGFKPLRHVLTGAGDLHIYPSPECSLQMFGRGDITLDTQAAFAHRGLLSHDITYGRYESSEKTTDISVAREWGAGAYIREGKSTAFVLVRPQSHRMAHENLVHLEYDWVKVPHESKYVITEIIAAQIGFEHFRSKFGTAANTIARRLVSEMSCILNRTKSDLVFDASRAQLVYQKWQRFSESVIE